MEHVSIHNLIYLRLVAMAQVDAETLSTAKAFEAWGKSENSPARETQGKTGEKTKKWKKTRYALNTKPNICWR